MTLRASGSVDDRRRRLLTGEVVGSPSAPEEAEGEEEGGKRRSSRKPGPRFNKSARLENQPRVTDLVPQRPWVIGLWLVLGFGVIAGLQWLYFYMPQMAAETSDGRVAAFDLDGEGNLGSWFSSAVLSLSGFAAILIYSLRKHRTDDYRGRYRVWLWAAACWFVMSIDETGSLHEGFKEMMTWLTGRRLLGDGSMWWVIGYGTVLPILGLRLIFDLRESWPATLAFLTAGACYAAAVVVQLGWLLPERGAVGVMVEEGLEMGGSSFLLLTMVLYSRYLIRDVQGLYAEKHQQKVLRAAQKAETKEAKAAAYEERRQAAAQAAKERAAAEAAAAKAKAKEKAATKPKKPAAAPAEPAEPAPSKKPVAKPIVATAAAAVSAKTTPNSTSPAASAKSALSSLAGNSLRNLETAKPTPRGEAASSRVETPRVDPAQPAASQPKLSKAQRKAMKRQQEMEERMRK